jgi:hypothetical protein
MMKSLLSELGPENTGNLGVLSREAAQNTQIPDFHFPAGPILGREGGNQRGCVGKP